MFAQNRAIMTRRRIIKCRLAPMCKVITIRHELRERGQCDLADEEETNQWVLMYRTTGQKDKR